jgi:hypothetical protein
MLRASLPVRRSTDVPEARRMYRISRTRRRKGETVDPVTIGLAVAAALATKATDKFGEEMGADAWAAIQGLYHKVKDRLSPSGAAALERLPDEGSNGDAAQVVAGEVQSAVAADPRLMAELQNLLAQASNSPRVVTLLAEARDNAKQINLAGDNTGTINM